MDEVVKLSYYRRNGTALIVDAHVVRAYSNIGYILEFKVDGETRQVLAPVDSFGRISRLVMEDE